METSVEEQQEQTPSKKSLGALLGELLNFLVEKTAKAGGIEVKKYSLAEIKNPAIIAGVILSQMQIPFLKRLGENPYQNGFSLVDLLSNLGHLPWETNQDYFEKLSSEKREFYEALRITLRGLSATKESSDEVKAARPLIEYRFEKPDANGETFRYQIVNPKLLEEIAAKPQSTPLSI